MSLYRRAGKRAVDLLVGTLVLLLASPLFLAVALTVLLADGRPILFRHERVGLGGRPFRLTKFRTMIRNADKLGPHYTDAGDPRVTRWGAFLRKYSLDELPQLLNVLRGDMSLVGPRPDTRVQIEALPPHERERRCSVRPGMTGLAQTRGRSSLSTQARLAFDLEYAGEVSALGDIRIMVQTALQVLRARGAW